MNALVLSLYADFLLKLSFTGLSIWLFLITLSSWEYDIILIEKQTLHAFLSATYPARWTNSNCASSIYVSGFSMILLLNYSSDSSLSIPGNLKMIPTLDWIVWDWEKYYLTGDLSSYLKRPRRIKEVCFIIMFSKDKLGLIFSL